jgi:MFS family permease
VRTLLRDRNWIFFLLTSFLGGLGAFSVAVFLYPYMAGLGATETQMGIASFVATFTEVPIFFFGHRLIRRFTSRRLFITAIILMAIRALMFSAVNVPFMVYIVQAIGGTMFPLMWLAGVTYADENAPAELKSMAQGLFGAMCFGFGSAVGGFIGGILLESMGGRSMFFVFGVVMLVALGLIEGARRIFPVKIASSIISD